MQRLSNKQIVLGVTGGIAAYKSAELIRQLTQYGATVRVVMTKAATAFITPLTLQALSGNPVHQDLLDPEAEAAMGHIELAKWADLILIAPTTADFIARLAAGKGDDLLTTICLATDAPIAIAPAMNQAMWRDQATVQNVELLEQRQVKIFGPASGEQACGDIGPGRMLEPAQLSQHCACCFEQDLLTGSTVVITAGPTREAIDPVRYISNHSSGKMGYALAEAASEAGAKVILVSGPTSLTPPPRVEVIQVVSALEMHTAVMQHIAAANIVIATAAVADYRPEAIVDQKIKKNQDTMTLSLVKNPDIIADVAAQTKPPFTVGFAAETQNVVDYAKQKLVRKKLNLIIANDVSDKTIGFNSDLNEVTVVTLDNTQPLPQTSKTKLARELIDIIAKHYHTETNQ